MTRVLVVDDDAGLRQSLGLLLTHAGYEVVMQAESRRGLEQALNDRFDLVLCDVRMPEMDGLQFLREFQVGDGEALVIMMSAYGGEDAALAAMKEGAYDYIPKPFRPDEVLLTLKKAEERERLRRAVAGLRAQLAGGSKERAVVAQSRAMREALDVVARVAEHRTTVLITGESGTGKEVIARAVHNASPRARDAFVAINCAAIPENLLESELFGHVRGAFTGATADKPGFFEQADGGTLFLDEIGEMPLALQAKLLRVLQDHQIRRIGDGKTRRVDVRIVVATARDLEAETRAGGFREDLFYRLNVVAIHLPPLAARREDIAPLAHHFAALLSHRLGRRVVLSDGAISWLEQQPWPGNVRELAHAIERAAVLNDVSLLESEHFTARQRPAPPAPAASDGLGAGTLKDVVERAEREAIQAALQAAEGNRRLAAQRLGISLRTLFYRIERFGLD